MGREVELRPAVLGTADVTALPEALELCRVGHPHAVDVARRDADGTRQPDEEGVEVGALAPEVPGLEHPADVADAAAAHLRIAERVLDDPLVDRARLVELRLRALRDLDRGPADDSIGPDETCGFEVFGELAPVFAADAARRREVHGAVARGEAGRHLDHGTRFARRPLGVEDGGAVLRLPVDARGRRVPGPALALVLVVVRVRHERKRQPYPCHARRIDDLGPRRHLEGAPRRHTWRRRAAEHPQRARETSDHRGRGPGREEYTSVHVVFPSPLQTPGQPPAADV